MLYQFIKNKTEQNNKTSGGFQALSAEQMGLFVPAEQLCFWETALTLILQHRADTGNCLKWISSCAACPQEPLSIETDRTHQWNISLRPTSITGRLSTDPHRPLHTCRSSTSTPSLVRYTRALFYFIFFFNIYMYTYNLFEVVYILTSSLAVCLIHPQSEPNYTVSFLVLPHKTSALSRCILLPDNLLFKELLLSNDWLSSSVSQCFVEGALILQVRISSVGTRRLGSCNFLHIASVIFSGLITEVVSFH